MRITTIEDDFEHQSIRVIQSMVDDFKDEDDECNGANLEEWLWDNKEELGRYFYERMDEYFGLNEIGEKIKWTDNQ